MTVASPGLLRFVYITGSRKCQHPETILSFIKCVIHNFWAPEELKGLIMVFSPYGETVCFSVNPIGRVSTYIVNVDRHSKSVVIRVDWTLRTLTFLFFPRLCRLTQNICGVCTFLSSSCGPQTPPSVCGGPSPLPFCKDLEPVSARFYICNGLIQRYKRCF